jgi:monoamine oxidase
VLILEARDRVGGRAWTRRMAGLDVPVELGAEFIHGRAQATLSLLRKAGMKAVKSVRTQRYAANGRLRSVDSFALAQKAMRDTSLLQERDLSFADYLARQKLDARTRTFARMMVEGFDAADPRLASAKAIAEEWGGGDALLGPQPRLRHGYGPALEWLAQSIVARGGRLRMQSPVLEVRWRRGRARVSGEGFRFSAPKVLVTLPLGVLQAAAVRFSPGLEKDEALKRLVSGPVVKAALRFPQAFWEKRFRGVAFFHSARAPFPTFWTPLPARVPLLIAWAGGPKAERLSADPLDEVMRSLKNLFARVPEPDAAYVQDWRKDPFACGAYSYVRVDGEGAREALQRPLADTLFFGGEATNLEGEAGTVSGALQSGKRAASELLRSAKTSR